MNTHENAENIICPYCGIANNDEKESLEFEAETDCVNCNKRFGYSMSISYSTNKL